MVLKPFSGQPRRARPRSGRSAIVLLLVAPLLAGAQAGPPAPVAPSPDLQRAEAALRANDQVTASRLFHDVLSRDPGNAEAHANLGAIAFSRGDCVAAEPDFRAALQMQPGLIKVQALLALCERRRGEASGTPDMVAVLNKVQDPRLHLELGMELANTYYQQGDLEKTATTLHELLVSSPENVDVLFFAQRVYSELADNTLNKLAVLSPNSARMEQLVAERLINAGDLKDAAQHYRKALQLSPRLPGLHFELAETLLESSPNSADTQKQALDELEAARQVDGDSAKVEGQLAHIAVLRSNKAEAMADYQRAHQLDPDDSKAVLGLADLYREQENLLEAAKYLRMAVRSDPFNPEAHYKLSQVDRQLHDDEESKRELKLFQDLRATQDRVKLLYREMNPQTAHADSAATPR